MRKTMNMKNHSYIPQTLYPYIREMYHYDVEHRFAYQKWIQCANIMIILSEKGIQENLYPYIREM